VNDYAIDVLQTGDNAVRTVRVRPVAPAPEAVPQAS
jgi:hypothetical protein